jgi:hypothetical protein
MRSSKDTTESGVKHQKSINQSKDTIVLHDIDFEFLKACKIYIK